MKWRRSPAEIRYRLGQELWNITAWVHPPRPGGDLRSFKSPFPPVEALAQFLADVPDYRDRLLRLASQVVGGNVPLLGASVSFPAAVDDPDLWRRDLLAGRGSEAIYFRRIPYLDATEVGDHKVIWELNRHQHLVLLAQAACLDPDNPVWLAHLVRQLDSWFQANPFHGGINWASALEVAFRALSWVWILHLAGDRLPSRSRDQLLLGLYRHAAHLEHNLSIYFAPNTHLLGEAVCLHALGCVFAALPEAPRWRNLGAGWVDRCLDTQVLNDGAYFEQSSFYHLYSVDLFLFHSVLRNVSDAYRDRLRQMCTWLATLTDLDGSFPLFGDDDGGRLFYPFGRRRTFARATLTLASFSLDAPHWRYLAEDYAEAGLWLAGPRDFPPSPAPASRRTGSFPDSGVAVGGDDRLQIILVAKAFGRGSAGHSHAHALHFILRRDQEDLLLDAGTFTYVGDATLRDLFRSTAAHNTVRVDQLEQGVPVNPFRWRPERWDGCLEEVRTEPGSLSVRATLTDPNGEIRITRTLHWSTGAPLVCEDFVEDAAQKAGEHLIEQFWHVPSSARWNDQTRRLDWTCGASLVAPPGTEADLAPSEVSETLYGRNPAQTLRISVRSPLSVRLRTVIHC